MPALCTVSPAFFLFLQDIASILLAEQNSARLLTFTTIRWQKLLFPFLTDLPSGRARTDFVEQMYFLPFLPFLLSFLPHFPFFASFSFSLALFLTGLLSLPLIYTCLPFVSKRAFTLFFFESSPVDAAQLQAGHERVRRNPLPFIHSSPRVCSRFLLHFQSPAEVRCGAVRWACCC